MHARVKRACQFGSVNVGHQVIQTSPFLLRAHSALGGEALMTLGGTGPESEGQGNVVRGYPYERTGRL
jgi:hypothetical protein